MTRRICPILIAIAAVAVMAATLPFAIGRTSAAWTDSANFTAPVSAGTWAPTQGPNLMAFNTVPRFDPVTAGKVTFTTQVANVYQDWTKDWTITRMTIQLTFPTAVLGDRSLISTTSPAGTSWSQVGSPTVVGTKTVFTFAYSGPPMHQQPSENTGNVSFIFPVVASPGLSGTSVAVPVVVSSPDAKNTLSASASFTAP